MTTPRPTPGQRDILQRLRTDVWRSFNQVNVAISEQLMNKLVVYRWIESRSVGGTLELRLTTEGLSALRAKIPDSPSLQKIVRFEPHGE